MKRGGRRPDRRRRGMMIVAHSVRRAPRARGAGGSSKAKLCETTSRLVSKVRHRRVERHCTLALSARRSATERGGTALVAEASVTTKNGVQQGTDAALWLHRNRDRSPSQATGRSNRSDWNAGHVRRKPSDVDPAAGVGEIDERQRMLASPRASSEVPVARRRAVRARDADVRRTARR